MCEWISPWNSPWKLAIAEGFAEANSVFIVITLAKTLLRWLFPSKIYIQFTVFNTYFLTKLLCTNKKYHLHMLEKYLYVLQEVRYIIYFRQFIHPLSLHSHGQWNKLSEILWHHIFKQLYFVSFIYHLFICWCQRKIILVTLSKSYLYKFFFQSFSLVYWASFFRISLYFWTQISHPKLLLKHMRKEHNALHITIFEFESNRMLCHWQRSHNFCYLMIVLVRGVLSAKLVLRYKHKFEEFYWPCLKIKCQQSVFFIVLVNLGFLG